MSADRADHVRCVVRLLRPDSDRREPQRRDHRRADRRASAAGHQPQPAAATHRRRRDQRDRFAAVDAAAAHQAAWWTARKRRTLLEEDHVRTVLGQLVEAPFHRPAVTVPGDDAQGWRCRASILVVRPLSTTALDRTLSIYCRSGAK